MAQRDKAAPTLRDGKMFDVLDEAIAELDSLTLEPLSMPGSPAAVSGGGKKTLAVAGDDEEPEVSLDKLEDEMERWEDELDDMFGSVAAPVKKAATPPPEVEIEVEQPPTPTEPVAAPTRALEFPPLHVFAYDPYVRIRETLEEEFAREGIAATVFKRFEDFEEAVLSSTPAEQFTVALLGSGEDVAEDVEQVVELCTAPPHVFVVYASDVGVSTIRRQVFQAGAWAFLEKPVPPGPGRKWDPHLMEEFQREVANAVADLYIRHKTYFDAIVTGERG